MDRNRNATLGAAGGAAVLGLILGAIPTDELWMAMIAGICIGLCGLSVIRPILLFYFVLATSVSTGLLHESGFVSLGFVRISASGLRWALVAGAAIAILIARCRPQRWIPRPYLPYWIFVAWLAVRWIVADSRVAGLEDIAFFVIPLLLASCAVSTMSSTRGDHPLSTLGTLAMASAGVPGFTLAFLALAGLAHWTPDRLQSALGARGLALYLLIPLALCVASFRFPTLRLHRLVALTLGAVALATIFATLSRTASVVALFLVWAGSLDPRRILRTLTVLAMGGIVSIWLMFEVPAMRDRLLRYDPGGTTIFQQVEAIDKKGRDQVWPLLLGHARDSLAFGWGPGSSRLYLARWMEKDRESFHPHNEFIRTLHDTGIVGLALLLVAWASLICTHYEYWLVSMREGDSRSACWQMAAVLGAAAILTSAITDNTLHYVPVVGPWAIVSGTALAIHRRSREALSC